VARSGFGLHQAGHLGRACSSGNILRLSSHGNQTAPWGQNSPVNGTGPTSLSGMAVDGIPGVDLHDRGDVKSTPRRRNGGGIHLGIGSPKRGHRWRSGLRGSTASAQRASSKRSALGPSHESKISALTSADKRVRVGGGGGFQTSGSGLLL
jgi:hypothetical protein